MWTIWSKDIVHENENKNPRTILNGSSAADAFNECGYSEHESALSEVAYAALKN